MRWLFYIFLVSLLTGCTSTRSLSKKFSTKPEVISTQFADAWYANASLDTTALYGQRSLWSNLSLYSPHNAALPQVSEHAAIRLSLVNKQTLKVTAYEGGNSVASFEIPILKRRKYLILQNKTRMIPIPFIYFSLKEHKSILAPLQNNRIGIYDYDDVALWILIFAANKTERSIHEYKAITH